MEDEPMIKAAGFRYIPKGAIKVADKNSDAVAYLYDYKGFPGLRVFYGKQSKPVVSYYYTARKDQTAEQVRTAAIVNAFKMRQQSLAYKAERRAARNEAAKAGKVEVGSYFYTSWGYDQTNIDWYRVEKLIGKTMALVVEVESMNASNGNEGWMQGKSVPGEKAVGEPFRVRLNGDGFTVKGRYPAYRWDGRPKNWTAYA
jgi:hypothetical protein